MPEKTGASCALSRPISASHSPTIRWTSFAPAWSSGRPRLAAIGEITPAPWGDFGTPGAVDEAPFASPVGDFYLTDPITRASQTMSECSAAFVAAAEARADG